MNYELIAEAAKYYEAKGYTEVLDAPWIVSKEAYYATKPKDAVDMKLDLNDDNRFMVASGEQSFIQLMMEGRALKRSFCITPCFRIEKSYNLLKKPYFTKLELINADEVSTASLMLTVHHAAEFFEKFVRIKIVEIADPTTGTVSYDILERYTRNELGSYGIRSFQHGKGKTAVTFNWIFATGIAEPRLSSSIKNQSHK